MAGDNKTEGLCARQAATLTCLPNTAIYAILETTAIGKDVAALLTALPSSTLPPPLIALRDLGAVVDLADHWPVVHVTKIPIEHAHLAIAALPAFAGIYVDAGFRALAWLDAKLPPMMPLTLVVDPSVLGMQSAFVYAWGDRVTNVLIRSHGVKPDPTSDMLARCVNVQTVTISVLTKHVAAAAYLAALPTRHLHTLELTKKAGGALDVSAIIAWLQGPSATSLDLTCDSVSDPTALARAIHDCSTLRALSLNSAADVQEALTGTTGNLNHVTALSLSQSWTPYNINMGVWLGKLDRANVTTISLRNKHPRALRLGDVGIFSERPSLDSLSLYNWVLPAFTTTDSCSRLARFTLRRVQFEEMESVPKMMRWLSTSHCLTSVDFGSTVLGREGVLELGRALPLWMASGLKKLGLNATRLNDNDAVILAVALASGRNRRPLGIDMHRNRFTIASAPVLLTTLGVCCDVKLHFGHTWIEPRNRASDQQSKDEKVLLDLVREHKLKHIHCCTFASPPRTSSPWHGRCM